MIKVSALVTDVVTGFVDLHDCARIGSKPSLKWQAVTAFIDGVITYPSNTAALIISYQWSQLSSFCLPDTFQALGEYRH